MQGLTDNLNSVGQVITDEYPILYILARLGQKYESIVVNLTFRNHALTLQEVQFALQTHEIRIQHQLASLSTDMQISPSINVAYRKSFPGESSNANRAGNSQFCSPSGRGHTGPSHGGFGRGNKPICQLYKKIGHVADKCYRRFDISFSGVGSTSYANSSSQANVLSTSNPTDHEWYVNSGATNHVIVDMNNLNIKANYMGNDRSFLLSKILSLLRSNYG